MLPKPFASIVLFLLFSCGSSVNSDSGVFREATDAPADFSGTFEDSPADNDCRMSLRDPLDDAELVLIRSTDGIGDYKVPLGKYNLSADELLRINCRTGIVIGIVKK